MSTHCMLLNKSSWRGFLDYASDQVLSLQKSEGEIKKKFLSTTDLFSFLLSFKIFSSVRKNISKKPHPIFFSWHFRAYIYSKVQLRLQSPFELLSTLFTNNKKNVYSRETTSLVQSVALDLFTSSFKNSWHMHNMLRNMYVSSVGRTLPEELKAVTLAKLAVQLAATLAVLQVQCDLTLSWVTQISHWHLCTASVEHQIPGRKIAAPLLHYYLVN